VERVNGSDSLRAAHAMGSAAFRGSAPSPPVNAPALKGSERSATTSRARSRRTIADGTLRAAMLAPIVFATSERDGRGCGDGTYWAARVRIASRSTRADEEDSIRIVWLPLGSAFQ